MAQNAITKQNDFSRIILSSKNDCKKVIFDIGQLRKPEKVCAEYQIPSTESILAFCKSSVSLYPMTIEGIILTDQAIYFCPARTLNNGATINHILYTAMVSYLFTQEGKNGVVHAQTLTDEIRILGPSFSSQNKAGTEIRKILRSIQNHLFHQDPLAKHRFDTLAVSFLKQIKQEIGLLEISDRSDAILYGLMKFPDHADAAAMLKAEYLFREFLPEKYEKFTETLPRRVSEETKTQIIHIPTVFTQNYVSTLMDLSVDYKYKDLSKIYEKCYRRSWKNVDTLTICAYLSIRMHDAEKFAEVNHFVHKERGKDAAYEIELFRGIYSYHMMQGVYSAIKNSEDFHPAYQRFRDGVGLTPLHYAIIMKNEKAVSAMLKNSKWFSAAPLNSDELFAKFYNYLTLAYAKQLPYYDDILIGTNNELIILKRNIKFKSNELKFQNVICKLQNVSMSTHLSMYRQQRRSRADEEKLQKLVNSMLNLSESIEYAHENAENIVAALEDYIEEFKCIVEDRLSEAVEILNESQASGDPLVRYLYRLYFEPDFFEQVLFAAQNNQPMHLYVHKGFYFVAPEFAEINLPPLEAQNTQKKKSAKAEPKKKAASQHTPIYGNSWFSSHAHHDADILKSEYRKLAKQYHPDVSDLEDSTRLFQSISAEYKELLEKLSAKS